MKIFFLKFLKRALLVFFFLSFCRVLCGEIIPSSRRIDWNPGVRGGIPNRAVVYATLSPGENIQSAINSCPSNQVVKLNPGNYSVGGSISLKSGVTLRGAGIGNTVISASSGNSVVNWNNGFDYNFSSPAKNLVSPTKGNVSITTSAPHGWLVGDILLVDMLENANGNPPVSHIGSLGSASWVSRNNGTRPIGQLVKVVAVINSTTVNIDPPLYWSYDNSPQALKLTGLIHYAGLEDLTINNLSNSRRDTTEVFGAINCWMKNVELRGSYRRAIWFYAGLWFTMEHCLVVGGVPIGTDKQAQYTSDRSYGPFIGICSASLFQDNIMEKLTMGIAFEGPGSGNVFAYNFITNIWWRDTGDSPRRFGMLMHGPHPFMNLYEGNWSSDRIRADEYWGTSSHFISLRNRIIQSDRGPYNSQTWTVDVERRNWYWSFVGNLFGGYSGDGYESNYEYINGESVPYSEERATIWKIGYNSLGTGGTLYDYSTLQTMIRWGNWCYRTNDTIAGSGITWHISGVQDVNDRDIPKSYYLTSKPSWFGFLSWPPYNPTNSSIAALSHTNIPAGYRYVYGIDPDNGQAIQPLPPINLRITNL